MINSPIVSTTWLFKNLDHPNLIILDASLIPVTSNDYSKIPQQAIKGSRFFDLKNVFSDTESPFPNTFPSSDQFEKACQELGINNNSLIVVYDYKGVYTSPRVWWMFKTMGYQNIAVLDGGLPKWINEELPLSDSHETSWDKGNFSASKNTKTVTTINEIEKNIQSKEKLVIDARSSDRFNGIVPEPRKGLRSGHIPNSINIPYTTVLNNGAFKSKTELEFIFKDISKEESPLIFSCGSGVTACIALLALTLIDTNHETTVYDGSWTEWATMHP